MDSPTKKDYRGLWGMIFVWVGVSLIFASPKWRQLIHGDAIITYHDVMGVPERTKIGCSYKFISDDLKYTYKQDVSGFCPVGIPHNVTNDMSVVVEGWMLVNGWYEGIRLYTVEYPEYQAVRIPFAYRFSISLGILSLFACSLVALLSTLWLTELPKTDTSDRAGNVYVASTVAMLIIVWMVVFIENFEMPVRTGCTEECALFENLSYTYIHMLHTAVILIGLWIQLNLNQTVQSKVKAIHIYAAAMFIDTFQTVVVFGYYHNHPHEEHFPYLSLVTSAVIGLASLAAHIGWIQVEKFKGMSPSQPSRPTRSGHIELDEIGERDDDSLIA